MRSVLVAMLVACGTPGVPIDGAIALGSDATFDVPIGAVCGELDRLCAGGLGACSEWTCRKFCSPVDFPRCPTGEQEYHSTFDGGDRCVCVPR